MDTLQIQQKLTSLENILKTIFNEIIGLKNDDYKFSLNYSDFRGIDIKIISLSNKTFAKILGKKAKTIQSIRRLIEIWGTRNSMSVYISLESNEEEMV
ncbi:MAG: hypothetical protein ABIL76_08640 [candidate division WOR-3 bacterium]